MVRQLFEPPLHSFNRHQERQCSTNAGILLKSSNIKLGWIRAHVGYNVNEAVYELAKKATQEGTPQTSQSQEAMSGVSYKKSPSSVGK
ncbi:hypothetical protein AVEN_26492-1 [Araneus ventricosus]|uniref:Uncharacterized protein n=1 Tax=Araneus ventricosus TaxID=182803 RepID=A0A4Y2CU89_ARAVE|nr:hypothetical protein AVEN_26492-1 [Araneus ventricosus]